MERHASRAREKAQNRRRRYACGSELVVAAESAASGGDATSERDPPPTRAALTHAAHTGPCGCGTNGCRPRRGRRQRCRYRPCQAHPPHCCTALAVAPSLRQSHSRAIVCYDAGDSDAMASHARARAADSRCLRTRTRRAPPPLHCTPGNPIAAGHAAVAAFAVVAVLDWYVTAPHPPPPSPRAPAALHVVGRSVPSHRRTCAQGSRGVIYVGSRDQGILAHHARAAVFAPGAE